MNVPWPEAEHHEVPPDLVPQILKKLNKTIAPPPVQAVAAKLDTAVQAVAAKLDTAVQAVTARLDSLVQAATARLDTLNNSDERSTLPSCTNSSSSLI